MARQSRVRPGSARTGAAWRAWCGLAKCGLARMGTDGQGRRGQAGLGNARFGMVRTGVVRCGRCGKERKGGQGRGTPRHGRPGEVRPGEVGLGVLGHGWARIGRIYHILPSSLKSCGITHAIPQKLIEGLQHTGGYYYCPNGHQWGWGESEAQRLRAQLKTEQDERRRVETKLVSVQDQLQATTREVQRHKKRVANGVCPCCNRTFQQLQRHMKTKHPDYAVKGK